MMSNPARKNLPQNGPTGRVNGPVVQCSRAVPDDSAMKTQIASAVTETLLYHEQTKHHFHRYARSAGSLDWANQPNPFRAYEGVTAVKLPLLQKDPASEHQALYERSRNTFQKFTRETIGAFLELSLGLSAWKSIPGNSWALRVNPSSGNLHPTEIGRAHV